MSFRLGHKIAIIICTLCFCVTTAFADDFFAPFVGSGYVNVFGCKVSAKVQNIMILF